MPGRRRRLPETIPAGITFVQHTANGGSAFASAVRIVTTSRIDPKKKTRKSQNPDIDWQTDVREAYREVGELRYGLNWKAAAVSRCTLVAAQLQGGRPKVLDSAKLTTDQQKAVDVLQQFAGGQDGQSALLRSTALPLEALGLCYAVIGEGNDTEVFSPFEVQETSGNWKAAGKDIPDDKLVIEFRRKDPFDSRRVDSPVRSALPILRELRGLDQHLLSAIDSRLAGAGLLLLPESASPPPPGPTTEEGTADQPEDQTSSNVDPFMVALMDAMLIPLQDRESAAAVVPILSKIADSAAGKAQYIRFDGPFDPEFRSLRAETVGRLAIALDEPAEMLTGLGESNHWNGRQVGEEAAKFSVVPLAADIARAFTEEWYRPALELAGVENPNEFIILVDPSELFAPADTSKNALEAYDRSELTGQGLRRELGLNEGDAPTPEEQLRILLVFIAKNAPLLAPQAIKFLFPKANVELTTITGPNGGVPDLSGRPEHKNPESTTHEKTSKGVPGVAPPPNGSAPPANTTASAANPMKQAVHVAILRALELAGKRWIAQDRSRRSLCASLPLSEVYVQHSVTDVKSDTLLADAWNALSDIAEPCLVSQVDGYVRSLLDTGTPHSFSYLDSLFLEAEHVGCTS